MFKEKDRGWEVSEGERNFMEELFRHVHGKQATCVPAGPVPVGAAGAPGSFPGAECGA